MPIFYINNCARTIIYLEYMSKACSPKVYKKRKLKRWIIWLTIILLIFSAIFLYFNHYVNPIIVNSNASVIKAKTSSIINQSIANSLQLTDVYDKLITVTTDSSGNVTSISANSLNANTINNTILTSCQEALNQQTNLYFEVPLGTFSGIPLLNGIGPNIKIKMLPVGNIQSTFKSSFTSMGINQTHHEIFLNFKISMSVLLPGFDKTVEVNTQVLIGESVIVGKVPEIYFGSNNIISSQLNLVP